MPRLWKYKSSKADRGIADFYVKDKLGVRYVTYGFFLEANTILTQKHSEVGNGGAVTRAWIEWLRHNKLVRPTSGESAIGAIDIPDELIPFEDLVDVERVTVADDEPFVCLVHDHGAWKLCFRLPQLPYDWLEQAGSREVDKLRASDAAMELGSRRVAIERLRLGPIDLEIDERLLTPTIAATLAGTPPVGLDLSGHCRAVAGIQNGFALFGQLNNGEKLLAHRSVAPGDRFLAFHKVDHPWIDDIKEFCRIDAVASLYNQRWAFSNIYMPNQEGSSFNEAADVLNLHPAALRWEVELLLPIPGIVLANGLRVVHRNQRLMVRLRQRRRGPFTPNAFAEASLTWVGANGKESPLSHGFHGRAESIVELPCPGQGRWDLWVHGDDGFPARLSFDFVGVRATRPWNSVAPLAISGSWNGAGIAAKAWSEQPVVEVPSSYSLDWDRLSFESPALPENVRCQQRFEAGAVRGYWRFSNELAGDFAAAIASSAPASLIFDAGAFGCVQLPFIAAPTKVEPEPRSFVDDDDAVDRWLRTIARVSAGRSELRVRTTRPLASAAAVLNEQGNIKGGDQTDVSKSCEKRRSWRAA